VSCGREGDDQIYFEEEEGGNEVAIIKVVGVALISVAMPDLAVEHQYNVRHH
jgi:hypothetical protein